MSSVAYSQSKRVQNHHLTRERDRRRGRELAAFVLALLPVACAFLIYAALHIETVRVGYARESRAKAYGALTEENRRLHAQLALASAPERVSAVAAHKNLKPARPGQIEFVEAQKP